MLPPGHIAAGFLTALAVIKLTGSHLSPGQIDQILLLGGLIGFVPDLDIFGAFAKVRKFKIDVEKADHRRYLAHAPILWLVGGLAVFFTSTDPFIKTVGLVIWLSSWSHFLCDTLQYGIMWLWPFSKKLYAIKDRETKMADPGSNGLGFFAYWLKFIRLYTTKAVFSFSFEVLLIVAALLASWRHFN